MHRHAELVYIYESFELLIVNVGYEYERVL